MFPIPPVEHWRNPAFPSKDGNVTYVMIIDPALKDADYNIVNILNEAFPAEIQALFKSYTDSFASGLIPINLVPVVDYGK